MQPEKERPGSRVEIPCGDEGIHWQGLCRKLSSEEAHHLSEKGGGKHNC